jgi:citrate synthase
MQDQTAVRDGLEGVVAATTKLSAVDGERGELIIAGHTLRELAANWSFEEVVDLLWRTAGATIRRPATLELPPRTLNLLLGAARERLDPMDALRMAIGSLRSRDAESDARSLMGSCPAIVAAYARLLAGREPLARNPALGLSANFLYMLTGNEPEDELVAALDTYLTTVCDHGFNASTFTARVIVSTGSDFISAVTGAIGALKGPLHGGAPGPALDTVFAIERKDRAESFLRAKLERGERLMGFGHRIYNVRDPRADVLNAAVARMFEGSGDTALYELARHVEGTAVRLLAEYKPARDLQTNVEFFTALLLHGLGIDREFFTPTFAIGRMAGWIAHCIEQRAEGRLIRPQSLYVGELPQSELAAQIAPRSNRR